MIALCAPTDHPPSDAFVVALMPSAPRYFSIAGGRRRQRAKEEVKSYPIGYFHVDIAEVHTAEGRLYLLVAIDRTSKFAFTQLVEKATRRIAGNFLWALAQAVAYKSRPY